MSKLKKRSKVLSGVLAASMLLSLPVTNVFAADASVPGAQYSPVQLQAYPTKQVVYYKAGSEDIPDIDWVTSKTDLVFIPADNQADVTCAIKDADGVFWIGTLNGLQRVDFTEKDARDVVQYMAGARYLYGADDNVTGLASDGAGGIWVRNALGVTHIAMPKKTLQEKSEIYEKITGDVHTRRGMVTGTTVTFTETDAAKQYVDYNSPTGVFTSTPSTSDNDGLWTAMYAMGEIFRYQALKTEYAHPTVKQQAEINVAKAAALKATKAVLLLDYVSGRGNGFPARSYMLTSEAGAQTSDGTDYGYQSTNGFWFHSVMDGTPNPNAIVPSMVQEGKTPIGYSIVRVTKDSVTKKGDTLFPSGGHGVMNYNGVGLSPDSIEAINAGRSGQPQLGTDLKTLVDFYDEGDSEIPVYQVMPVITQKTLTDNAANKTVSEDKTTTAANKPLFQLTVPIYEKIPQFFNDLFPASAIAADGYIDQNQIVYKADTSSDEVDGHYALFMTAYKYLCDDDSDESLVELKTYIAEATDRMTNLIIQDRNYFIKDATGKSTQWSRWLSKYFNDSLAVMEGQQLWAANVGVDGDGNDALSYGYEDGPLNALEVMAALKTAAYVTKETYPEDAARFEAEYEKAFDGDYSKEDEFENGKGYIGMALDYIKRRIVRQATSAYDILGQHVATSEQVASESGYGDAGSADEYSNINATIHNDWTQYINYSDEELGWFPVYQLVVLEEDQARYDQIVASFDQWFENEVREENPFYTFLYQLAHPEKSDVDLDSAVRFLYRMPEYRFTYTARFDRQDIFYIEPGNRDKVNNQTNYALPTDERRITKDNSNPFVADAPYSADANFNYNRYNMEDGTPFTLPYWFGRLYGMIEEVQN
ncbi:hypothetical protein [Paenibacillus silvisoli]|uniref:hypothetical protein n=1 Tax=Paenibacillus silvisoli TaxID=3110539 RepID=UPI002805953A|nr:hypothetical protein [Paenibacillus silvisoli]